MVGNAILEVVLVHVCRFRVVVSFGIELAPYVEHRLPVVPAYGDLLSTHVNLVGLHVNLVFRAAYLNVVVRTV